MGPIGILEALQKRLHGLDGRVQGSVQHSQLGKEVYCASKY